MHLLLLPGRRCCYSPTMSPHALYLGLQKSPMPCGERSQWRVIQPVISIPSKEVKEPLEVLGSSVTATQLFQHPTSGEMYIDMFTCMLSIVDLGFNTMADDCPVPGLWELPSQTNHPLHCLAPTCPIVY